MDLTVAVERWPTADAFVIARGAKTHVGVVVVTLHDGDHVGRGEATPIYYHGEDAEGCAAAIRAEAAAVRDVSSAAAMIRRMPRGAARNALDAALWDLEAKRTGIPVWTRAGMAPPRSLPTAYTISLGTPERMEADARRAVENFSFLKLKLAGDGDIARVAAVRRGAPDCRLIVDANEAWTDRDVAAEAAALVPFGVELIEQPVKAGADHLLDGIASPIALCADESCQDRADLARCSGRYSAINIKLDKAGGLTEALALAQAAQAAGFELMVGCMLSTSLGIAPAFLVAQSARWVDLDGPLLLAKDRPAAFAYRGGMIHPASNDLWG